MAHRPLIRFIERHRQRFFLQPISRCSLQVLAPHGMRCTLAAGLWAFRYHRGRGSKYSLLSQEKQRTPPLISKFNVF